MHEGRMDGGIGDALAGDPDFGFELAQRAQIVVARSRTHQIVFTIRGPLQFLRGA